MSACFITSKSSTTYSALSQLMKHSVSRQRPLSTSAILFDSSKILDDTDPETKKIRKELGDLPDKKLYPEYQQEGFGWVYSKQPIKYKCTAGKAYFWCACGRSHTQPFCDGTHKNQHLKIALRPVRWDCQETKEYWFCMCKHTQHRPFCDGTHKLDIVQKADSTIASTAPISSAKDVKKIIKAFRKQGLPEEEK